MARFVTKIKGGEARVVRFVGAKIMEMVKRLRKKTKNKTLGKSEDILFSWTCKIQAQILALNTKPASYAVIMVTV